MKTREEVLVEDRWNVETLYPSQEAWDISLKAFVNQSQQTPHWPELQALQGTLHQGPEKVKEVLNLMIKIDRELSKLYTYAHLRHDEDITNPQFKKGYEQILTLAHAFAQESAWFEPELLSLPETLLESYLTSSI